MLLQNYGTVAPEANMEMRARIMHRHPYTSVQADKLGGILLSSLLNYSFSSGYVLDHCMLSQPF